MKHADIYIIIVTYNGMKWLERCLKSTAPYPVIVVDNNSSDDTVAFIKKNHPEITLIEQPENLGFGGANNIGICHALEKGCEGVFLLNQDAYLYPDTLDILSAYSIKNPDYGLLSPVHLDGSGERLDPHFSHFMDYDNNRDFYSDAVLREFQPAYDIPFINAAAWFLPRKTLEEIGGFDPIFFHYGEDDNYCQRLVFHNKKLGVMPESKVRHDRVYHKKKWNKEEINDPRETEKWFKVKWANINIDFKNKDTDFIRLQQFKLVKFFTTGKWKNSKRHLKLYQLQAIWSKSVQQSRSINKTKGAHYL